VLAANEPTEARCKWCALQMCIGTTSALTISTTKCTTPCEMADLQQVAAAVGASTQLEQSNTCISSYQVSQHFTCNARGWRTPWQTRRRTHGTSPTSANHEVFTIHEPFDTLLPMHFHTLRGLVHV